jgi:hypothetical protein
LQTVAVMPLVIGRVWCCRHDLFRLALGMGIAIGLSSECFFAGLVSGHSGLWLGCAVLLAAAIGVVVKRRTVGCIFCQGAEDSRSAKWLACAFGLLLSVEFAVFAWASARSPRGNWDAWAIWNLRAHFLYRAGGTAWRDGFTEALAWSHPDYPLLLPAFIARTWTLLGRESAAVPIALGCFFTFGSVVLMASSIAILRGTRQCLLAGLALAATPVFFVQGAMQCADVPVAFFRLASLAALAVAYRFDNRVDNRGFAALAGAAAALDGWAKNEGLLWFGSLLIGLGWANRRALVSFLAGSLPLLGPILFFKARVATSSDIFGAAGRSGMAARVLDPSRYLLIATEALKHVWTFGPLFLSPFVLLGVYLAVAGLRKANTDSPVIRAGVLASALTAAGYGAIYLLRPLDLRWLLDTSADRLLVQLWPGIVFLVFLAARAPDSLSGDL